MAVIAFIGMGNMGYAMMKGMLGTFDPQDLVFSCKRESHGREVEKETGVTFKTSNAECVKDADIVFLAIKPVVYPMVINEVKEHLKEDAVVISLAPTYTVEKLTEMTGRRVVRINPNTPARVKDSMTSVVYDEKLFSEEEKDLFDRIFRSFGEWIKLEERLMDGAITISGCAPAFIYMMINALADAGVRYGLHKDEAVMMAARTVEGCGKMVLETGIHPEILKDQVCSPGGTTIAGVEALERNGFRGVIMAGCAASYEKNSHKE